MKGLATHAEKIFEEISRLHCIKDYCLIGGTALSLQLNHRLGEDLDFCRWKPNERDRINTSWPGIEKELLLLGPVSKNLLDHNRCVFNLKGVKISFYGNNISREPAGLVQ